MSVFLNVQLRRNGFLEAVFWTTADAEMGKVTGYRHCTTRI